MTKIYYVGMEVEPVCGDDLKNHFRSGIKKFLHVTIVYSREWFPYKANRRELIIIKPPYILDRFREQFVLRFESSELAARHNEFRMAGATTDFANFAPHISLGPTIEMFHGLPNFNIILYREYYGTWEEREALEPPAPLP